ncbi:MAG: cysteine hydrolase family protein [Frankia sp.]
MRIDETIANCRRVIDSAHDASLPVVYTRHMYRSGHIDAGIHSRERFETDLSGALLAGTWDVEVIDELRPTASDHIVDEPRMDAFYNTSLEVLLRGLNARHLLVIGIVSNACVETTTRSAAMRDFAVTVLEDCCTTFTKEDQATTMNSLERFGFATVTSIDFFISPVSPQVA